jgi:hypothetical protein
VHTSGFGSGTNMQSMPELGHDILAAAVVVLTAAMFAVMIWAGRVH